MNSNKQKLVTLTGMMIFVLILYWFSFDFTNNSIVVFLGEVIYTYVPLVSAFWLYMAYKQVPRPEKPFWFLLSLGFLSCFSAQLVWDYYDIWINEIVPFPGIPDLFFSLQYFCFLIAFTSKIIVEKKNTGAYRYFIDILIIISVLATFSYHYLIEPIVQVPDFTGMYLVLSIGYPLGDLVLLLLGITLYLDSPRFVRRNNFSFLFSGLFLLAITDFLYLYIQAISGYQSWNAINPLYLVSYLLIGFAGYRRSKYHQPYLSDRKTIAVKSNLSRHIITYIYVIVLFVFLLFVPEPPILIGATISILLIIFQQIYTSLQNEQLLAKIKRKTNQLTLSEERYRSLFEYHTYAVVSLDLQGNIVSGNPQFFKLTGYQMCELKNINLLFFVLDMDKRSAYKHFLRTIKGNTQNIELVIKDKHQHVKNLNVNYVPIFQDQQVVGVYCIANDITQNRKNENQINHLAFHDSLTNLPNRRYLEQLLDKALKEAKHNNKMVAVLLIDLDHFKVINDTFGHSVGDLLLIEVARRLKQSLSKNLVACRHGGDEFILLLTKMEQRQDIVTSAEMILNYLNEPYHIDKHVITLTPSIGISIFPDDAGNGPMLMNHADKAMYRVKHQGKNKFMIYKSVNHDKSYRRLTIEKHIHTALDNEELMIYYQPQVSTETGEIQGMEALVRWKHPELGMISPAEFIPLAEITGTIFDINNWVLEEACVQLKKWQQQGHQIQMAVNISPQQFYIEEDLISKVKDILANHHLNSSDLVIEITEAIAIKKIDIAIDKLIELKKLGVQVALDDFGTGFSSLSYLTQLPIDTIKIAREFINEIGNGSDNEAILSSLLTMAKDLRLKVVIEGVETNHQLSKVIQYPCHLIQGYYYSRPIPESEMELFLSSWIPIDNLQSNIHS